MNFEKARKDFIIDEDEYSQTKLTELMAGLSQWAKVTKDGQVILMQSKVPTRKMLKLIVTSRLIAHIVCKDIPAEVTRDELRAYSKMKDNVFTVRFNEMLREKFVVEHNKGYKTKNVLLAEQFLGSLKRER